MQKRETEKQRKYENKREMGNSKNELQLETIATIMKIQLEIIVF